MSTSFSGDPLPRATFHAAFRSRLFLATVLPVVDGTLAAVAARGGLSTPAGATLVGLTVIAGAGAWSSARREFAGGGHGRALAALVVVTTIGAVLAAWAGAEAGERWPWFPVAAGAVVLSLAANDLRRLLWTR